MGFASLYRNSRKDSLVSETLFVEKLFVYPLSPLNLVMCMQVLSRTTKSHYFLPLHLIAAERSHLTLAEGPLKFGAVPGLFWRPIMKLG